MKRYYDESGHPLINGLPVDICIFTVVTERRDPATITDKRSLRSLPERILMILLVQRRDSPDKDCWALPGGFTDIQKETLEMAAIRELKEETNLDAEITFEERTQGTGMYIEQVRAYYSPERDPRGWIPTVAYAALVNESLLDPLRAGGDAKEAQLFEVSLVGDSLLFTSPQGQAVRGDELAFDHGQIIRDALKFIEEKMLTTTVAKTLLPDEFTIAELRQVVSTVVPEFPVSTSNFTRDLVNTKSRDGLLVEVVSPDGVPKKSNEYSSRPAQLYRFREGYEARLSIYPRL